jgi:dUTP pyrophosphatase
MDISLKILPHAEGLALPHYATMQSAGMDLLAAVQAPLTIAPHSTALVPTGLCLALPAGFEAQVRPRSGLALKNAVTVLNSPGTIDADYRGEISVILINHSSVNFVIERGMRIAQMVIAKHETAAWNVVQDLDETARGTGGFGSTGVKSA